jgi:hypothetical protein
MNNTIRYQTVTPILLSILQKLMQAEELKLFRLVGGTSLSLQLGHRQSVDIDLFTDAEYGSIDFSAIDLFLNKTFSYIDSINTGIVGMGKSYFIGESAQQCIKLDLFYTDHFIRPVLVIDGLRLADLEEITAMKIDVIARGGRKKDFWDIHELLETFTIGQMLKLHQERYPYSHNRDETIRQLVQFEDADNDFDPICVKHKYWELIKLDIHEKLEDFKKVNHG